MKRLLIILGIVAAIIVVAMMSLRIYTKSFSPEAVAEYSDDAVQLDVRYCQPSAQGREIFGGLIPFGEVWRTGANEATVFSNTEPLSLEGAVLPAGSYSVFTVPGEEQWTVIFNSETGQWGVDPLKGGKANHDAEKDVMSVEVPAIQTEEYFETFTISLEAMGSEYELIMMWENTMIVVPMVLASAP